MKSWQLSGIEPRAPGLSYQCSTAELRPLDNHQPSQSSICIAHTVWLLGVWLKYMFSTTCAVHIEDCEGWWLLGGHSSHWLLKPGVLVLITLTAEVSPHSLITSPDFHLMYNYVYCSMATSWCTMITHCSPHNDQITWITLQYCSTGHCDVHLLLELYTVHVCTQHCYKYTLILPLNGNQWCRRHWLSHVLPVHNDILQTSLPCGG